MLMDVSGAFTCLLSSLHRFEFETRTCVRVSICICVYCVEVRTAVNPHPRETRQDREQSRYNWTRGCRVTLKKTPALIVPLQDEEPIDAIIVDHYRRSRNVVVKFLTEKSEKERGIIIYSYPRYFYDYN